MTGKLAEDKKTKTKTKQKQSKTKPPKNNPSSKNGQKDSGGQEAIAMFQTHMLAPAIFSNPSK